MIADVHGNIILGHLQVLGFKGSRKSTRHLLLDGIRSCTKAAQMDLICWNCLLKALDLSRESAIRALAAGLEVTAIHAM